MKNKLLLAVGSMALLTACDASKGNEMAWFDHHLDRLFEHGGHEFFR